MLKGMEIVDRFRRTHCHANIKGPRIGDPVDTHRRGMLRPEGAELFAGSFAPNAGINKYCEGASDKVRVGICSRWYAHIHNGGAGRGSRDGKIGLH